LQHKLDRGRNRAILNLGWLPKIALQVNTAPVPSCWFKPTCYSASRLPEVAAKS
jgi:hypothetical protein